MAFFWEAIFQESKLNGTIAQTVKKRANDVNCTIRKGQPAQIVLAGILLRASAIEDSEFHCRR